MTTTCATTVRSVVATAGCAALLLATAPPAGAGPAAGEAAAAGTTCTATVLVNLVPGLGLSGSSGSFYGKGGKLTCAGPVRGRTPTGPGTIALTGRFGTDGPDTCVEGGEGWVVDELRVPTERGTVLLRSPATFTYRSIDDAGPLSGKFKGDFFSGTFTTIPVKGDCVTSAVTRLRLTLTGVVPS